MTKIDQGIQGIVRWLDMLTSTAKGNSAERYPHWAHHHLGEILIKHGRIFRPQSALPVDNLGPAKRCFHNSMEVAFTHDHLTYVEGFASAVIPTEHAWCADANGALYETTWTTPGNAYLGIPFKWDIVAQVNDTDEFASGGGFVLGSTLLPHWLEHGFDESLTVDIGEPLANLHTR
ncbi:hypothetical protein ACFYN0_26900 [Streptomyces sp. NPDC006704]|uniref:hypothetical protein n=1 Tax=Streptomyces sp. NPDC006704 TaxID=3364760 RepID=UPI0036B4A944